MEVYVDKTRCTGCQHCVDVCPVGVYEMHNRDESANTDSAPEEARWTGKVNEEVKKKWENVNDGHRHFAYDNDGKSGGLSSATNGSACILCQACLIECEGECIHIKDDNGNTYTSIYK